MKTRKTVSLLLLLLIATLIKAQTGQTQFKLEAGSVVTHKLIAEVEKHFPGRIAVFMRVCIIQPGLIESGLRQSKVQPLIGGIGWKVGPKYYITQRFALRPEIGFSRMMKPIPEAPNISRVEFTRGVALTISYTLPIKGKWFFEPFAGLGAFRIAHLIKKPVEGFTNDYADEYCLLSGIRTYGTATHLSVNGRTGIVAGMNIGYAFHME